MKIISERKFKNILPYLCVVLIVTIPWFFHSGCLFFTDSAWGPNIDLNWLNNWFLFNSMTRFFSYVLPLDLLEKIFITLALLTVLAGGKKIAENFLEKKWMVFAVSLFFLFNPFIYDRIMYGQFSVILSFGFLCWLIGYLLQYWRNPSYKKSIITGIYGGLAIQFLPQSVFFVGLFLLLFCLLIILVKNSSKKYSLIKYLRDLFFVFCIIFIINANWTVGFLVSPKSNIFMREGVQENDLLIFQTSGKTAFDAEKNVLMMSGFWGKEQFRYTDITQFKENWGRSFYLLLPLILWGVIVGVKNRKTRHLSIGLLAIFVISTILAVGIKAPISRQITLWLFDNFPFYKGFREPQKWVALIVIVYGIFLTLGVKELFSKKIVLNNRILISIILSAIIIMQAPFLLWGLGGQIKPTKYPNDWYEINQMLTEYSKCKENILFLPWHMYMSFNWIGNIVANPAGVFFTCPVISGTNMEWGGIYDNSQSQEGRFVLTWIRTEGKTKLLENPDLNIGYVILAKEVDWASYSWLDKSDSLQLIRETDTLKTYKVIKKTYKVY